eukprot:365067-Chlamydomonas_euryale.AAC.16
MCSTIAPLACAALRPFTPCVVTPPASAAADRWTSWEGQIVWHGEVARSELDWCLYSTHKHPLALHASAWVIGLDFFAAHWSAVAAHVVVALHSLTGSEDPES